MDAQKIRLTPGAPVRCSSCFAQHLHRRHVDFGAAWDGPTFRAGDDEIAGGALYAIDDLMICETCLRAAGKLLGLQDWAELHERLAEAERARDELGTKLEAAAAHIGRLERERESGESIAELLGAPKSKARRRQPAAA